MHTMNSSITHDAGRGGTCRTGHRAPSGFLSCRACDVPVLGRSAELDRVVRGLWSSGGTENRTPPPPVRYFLPAAVVMRAVLLVVLLLVGVAATEVELPMGKGHDACERRWDLFEDVLHRGSERDSWLDSCRASHGASN